MSTLTLTCLVIAWAVALCALVTLIKRRRIAGIPGSVAWVRGHIARQTWPASAVAMLSGVVVIIPACTLIRSPLGSYFEYALTLTGLLGSGVLDYYYSVTAHRRIREMITTHGPLVCPRCMYPLSDHARAHYGESNCPECGAVFESDVLARNWMTALSKWPLCRTTVSRYKEAR